MKILGIETSCDETAAAVVENGRKILSNALASSANIQSKSGGIIPEVAAREHTKSITGVISNALVEASKHIDQKLSPNSKNREVSDWAKKNIDAISVTAGPGLIGCLLVGVESAKTLSFVWHKPIIPAVHTLAHLYANWLVDEPPLLPAVVLTVSGGHTDLLLMRDHGDFKILGRTRDDTAGEAFDKIARYLDLPFPGGPQIQKIAKQGDPKAFDFPRPLKTSRDFDFSFSGLKTAVIKEVGNKKNKKGDLAAATQDAIVDVLVYKAIASLKTYKAKILLLAGGVAANEQLRSELREKSPVPVRVPPIKLCTDNAAFVASYAFFNNHPVPWHKLKAESDTGALLEKYAKN